MENEVVKMMPRISDVGITSQFDVKLEGWSASAAIFTVCLTGVVLYGIKVFGEKKVQTLQTT